MTTRFTLFDVLTQDGNPAVFDFEGGLDRKGMNDVLDLTEEAQREQGHVQMLAELDGIPRVTWGAMTAKTQRAQALLRLEGHYAVVTDKKWMQTLMPLAQGFTKMQLQVFPKAELEKATAWAQAG